MINFQMEDTAFKRQEENKDAYLWWPLNIVLEVPTNTIQKHEKQQE